VLSNYAHEMLICLFIKIRVPFCDAGSWYYVSFVKLSASQNRSFLSGYSVW